MRSSPRPWAKPCWPPPSPPPSGRQMSLSMSARQLHLNVNLLHSGVYPSAWRLPASQPDAFMDVGHYVRVARIAERGKLDAIFLADTPSVSDRIDYRPFLSLEPTIVLASVAAATT